MSTAQESNIEIIFDSYDSLPSSLNDLLIPHPSSTFLGRASGHSMTGVGIFDNDILIIDRFAPAKQNDVIVANLNGEFVCKIVDIKQKRLLSANDIFSPYTVTEFDVFSIEGVVIQSIRCHRSSPLLSD